MCGAIAGAGLVFADKIIISHNKYIILSMTMNKLINRSLFIIKWPLPVAFS